jgi:hypothetical protein
MYLNENGQTRQEIVHHNAHASSTGGSSATQTETAPKTQSDSTVGGDSSGLIILHPSLEGSNYIIKALWLPGSQTELALVTSEFIKIYDLIK